MTGGKALTDWEGGAIDAHPPAEVRSAWMLTFADLVSLMLTFFVLMFALSGVREDRFREMAEALSHALNPPMQAATSGGALKNVAHAPSAPGTDLGYLASLLETVAKDSPALRRAEVALIGDRLELRLPAETVFAANAAAVAPAARPAVTALAQALSGIGNRLAVTVAGDAAAPGYADAWNFSLARAASLANALRAAGLAQPLRATGAAGPAAVTIVVSPDRGGAP